MAGPPDPSSNQFARLAALPPYVLAAVDELKSRLRAEGHDVFDFGLGNPDGPSPHAVIERLTTEAQRPGNQRYMPSRGLPEVRRAICDWYQRRYGQTFDPETEAVVTLGAKEGLAHLLLAIVGAGRLRAVARPLLPDPPLRRDHRGRRARAGGDAPRPGPLRARSRRPWRARRASPRASSSTSRTTRPARSSTAFFEKVVALAKRESLWVISDLAYADLLHDGRPAPCIFERAGRARRGGRVLHRLEELLDARAGASASASATATLVGALGTIKGYLDYGIFGPVQLAAATALRPPATPTSPPTASSTSNGRRCCATASRRRAGRCRGRLRRCSSGRRCRRAPWQRARWPSRPSCWPRPGSRFRPGVGFGPGGEGYVRFALVETDDRARQACAAIGRFLQGALSRIDKPAALK